MHGHHRSSGPAVYCRPLPATLARTVRVFEPPPKHSALTMPWYSYTRHGSPWDTKTSEIGRPNRTMAPKESGGRD